ncbi:MAG: hypothetical protein IPK72_08145 [Candidatus Eisenbacteria bacterium]|nr:hypothetical protein [Candidatus Eisenbacteria bacterium]
MKTNVTKIGALFLGLLAAACGSDRSVDPASTGATWTELRFHETAGAPGGDYQDLSISASGQLVLTSGRGVGQSVRGLLAGEKLETLARLIHALPPDSYAPGTGCQATFFVRVSGPDGERTFASGMCDTGAPSALMQIRERLTAVADEASEPRVMPVDFSVLLEGTSSGIAGYERHVVRSQDGLISLLTRHAARGSVAVPRVDFRTQMVVAEFLGTRTGANHGLSVAAVEQTEDGWLRIRWSETVPGTGCADGTIVRPFSLIAVPRQDGNLLFETERTVAICR